MTILDERPWTVPVLDAVPVDAVGCCRVPLLGGTAEAVYRRRGRWAITHGGVRAGLGGGELALSEYLEVLRARRLRPMFLGVPDRTPYARRGLYTYRYGSQAVLDLTGDNSVMAPGLRRDIEAADRAGVLVVPYRPAHAAQVARFAPAASLSGPDAEAWVAVQPDGAVLGVAVWVADRDRTNGDRAGAPSAAVRGLRLAALAPQAPEAVMTVLIADAVAEYSWRGVTALTLGWRSAAPWWPGEGFAAPAAVLPVLERLGPRWQDRWLAIPAGWQLPAAAWGCAERRSLTRLRREDARAAHVVRFGALLAPVPRASRS